MTRNITHVLYMNFTKWSCFSLKKNISQVMLHTSATSVLHSMKYLKHLSIIVIINMILNLVQHGSSLQSVLGSLHTRNLEAHSKEKFLNWICRDLLTMKFWHSEQSRISAKHPSQALLLSCELTNKKWNEWERRKNLAEKSRRKNLMCNSEILWQAEEAATILSLGWGEATYCWHGLIHWPFIFGCACTMEWDTWLNP